MDYELALRAVVTVAAADPNIRAVILTGSAAAQKHHPLSDRDIELHVYDPTPLEIDDVWWSSLGQVLAIERLENADDQPTRLVYYVGGKLDFTLVRVDGERGTYDRPFTVLLDKDGDTSDFVAIPPSPPILDQDLFDECTNWGYAAALMVAKAIVRDEPWSVKLRDNDLKLELLRMIEWDHSLRYGAARDVRYHGTRMRQWMDADVQRRLDGCWATFNGDTAGALIASVDLFSDLTSRVACAAELTDFDHLSARREIDRILARF